MISEKEKTLKGQKKEDNSKVVINPGKDTKDETIIIGQDSTIVREEVDNIMVRKDNIIIMKEDSTIMTEAGSPDSTKIGKEETTIVKDTTTKGIIRKEKGKTMTRI